MKRLIKFVSVAIFSIAAFVVSMFHGATVANGWPEIASPRSLYLQNCARCHGADGRANTPWGRKLEAPDLTASDVQSKSLSNIQRAVKNGRPNMPAFGKRLSPAQISAVARYVRSL